MFFFGTIMTPRERSLNCFKEQLKKKFPKNNHVPREKELKLF
jgi:hypothetical protein